MKDREQGLRHKREQVAEGLHYWQHEVSLGAAARQRKQFRDRGRKHKHDNRKQVVRWAVAVAVAGAAGRSRKQELDEENCRGFELRCWEHGARKATTKEGI